MTLGGVNVWTHFSYGSIIDTPNGQILNPQTSFLILFEKFNKFARKNTKVYNYLFYANELGELGRPKNTRLNPSDLQLILGMN